jgi:hypothetical protein
MKRVYAAIVASSSLLLSCGEQPSSKATYWRVSVAGSQSCLAELSQKLADDYVGIARFPKWNGSVGVMEFGPVPEHYVENLIETVRMSGCATVQQRRPSCSSDYSDVLVC